MTGFSSEKLTYLQDAGNDYVLAPSSLSPLSLYCTPLDQFTHHWDVVEVRSVLSYKYSKCHRLSYLLLLPVRTFENGFGREKTKRLETDIVLKIENS